MYLVTRWRVALSAVIFGGLLIGIIIALSTMSGSETDIALKYIGKCGWKVDDTTVNVSEYVIPVKWDDVMYRYNELQLSSGFDLGRYCGEKTTKVSVAVLNCGDNVFANVFVYKGKVIGGDVSSTAFDGFMLPLKTKKIN